MAVRGCCAVEAESHYPGKGTPVPIQAGDVATIDRYGYIRIVDRTEGSREVRRLMDLLGRTRERDHDPP
ncbi:hypothetical protein [Actinomadura rugatobispora]|uniref:Uncharacterized protein n=1 Tax=Actinomadura rugatobispora TaxID=1994 RepID=A0ABW0ZQ30_9ACTN|nr:hypothetical protein GCM10010200_035540 [Actinomadura rugatobispora]